MIYIEIYLFRLKLWAIDHAWAIGTISISLAIALGLWVGLAFPWYVEG